MPTPALQHANGKSGRFFVGSPLGEICIEEATLTEMAQEEDTTNSCSAGKEEFAYSTKHCEGTGTMTLDLAQHPYDSPPSIRAGTKVPARFFEFSDPATVDPDGSGKFWDFTAIGISQITVTWPQHGKVTFEFTWKSSGAYTNPDENVGSSG